MIRDMHSLETSILATKTPMDYVQVPTSHAQCAPTCSEEGKNTGACDLDGNGELSLPEPATLALTTSKTTHNP